MKLVVIRPRVGALPADTEHLGRSLAERYGVGTNRMGRGAHEIAGLSARIRCLSPSAEPTGTYRMIGPRWCPVNTPLQTACSRKPGPNIPYQSRGQLTIVQGSLRWRPVLVKLMVPAQIRHGRKVTATSLPRMNMLWLLIRHHLVSSMDAFTHASLQYGCTCASVAHWVSRTTYRISYTHVSFAFQLT